MFSGIVQAVGTVLVHEDGNIAVDIGELARNAGDGITIGESVAVDGVDVTVESVHGDTLHARLMPETLRRTTLRSLKEGDRVNLERSIRPPDRLSGHLVRGVVEGVAHVRDCHSDRGALIVRFQADQTLLRHMIVKGPITVNGVSLTLIEVTESDFSVSVVHHTRQSTTLGSLAPATPVNIETDVMARYVEHYLSSAGQRQ